MAESMSDQESRRKLVAVFVADMVGYSRLTEIDEAGTLARHKAHRTGLIGPAVEKSNGRIVKQMGDGILAEFASVVDAVKCAVWVQRRMLADEQNLPEDIRIQYRIGINLGDVICEGGDLFGDGVNIAARLEQLAEPGGICISGTAFDHLKSNVDASYEPQGEVQVRNISRPVRVYRVLIDPAKAGRPIPHRRGRKRWFVGAAAVLMSIAITGAAIFWLWSSRPDFEGVRPSTMTLALPDNPSIAVLPFANLSEDQDQEYFADGIADDMITDLSKLPGLFVIARNSSFAYKNKPVDAREIARQLGVRYILEGSVRRSGNEIRVNAQLIDAVSGGHLWAERYNEAFADLFEVQDRIRKNVISALASELGYDDQPDRPDGETRNSEAYDAFLNGRDQLRKFTPASVAAAIHHLERALRIDPHYARARATLAQAYFNMWQNRWGDELNLSSLELSHRASTHLKLALEEPTPLAHQVAASIAISRSQFDEAVGEANKAITLNANDPAGLIALARANLYADNADAALPPIEKALRLDPQHGPDVLALLGEIQFNRKDYQAALAAFQRALVGNPRYSRALLYLASTYGHLGKQQELESVIEQFNEVQIGNEKPAYFPGITDDPKYNNWADPQRLKAGLANAQPWRKLISGKPGDYHVEGATRVDVHTAKTFFDRNVLFFDLQGGNPYSVLTIPGAVRGNVLKMTRQSLSRIASKDQEIVFFERHYRYIGQAEAAAKAVYWGYTSIYHMQGGVWEWRDAGYPVEKR